MVPLAVLITVLAALVAILMLIPPKPIHHAPGCDYYWCAGECMRAPTNDRG